METQALGIQWIVELEACPAEPLLYVPDVEKTLLESARLSGAGIVTHQFHQFDPYGVSGVVVLSQSHITVHTWPEYGYAAVDLFFCGDGVNVEAAIKALEVRFKAKSLRQHSFERDTTRRASVVSG